MTDANSRALFAAAQLRIPGGVNSPVRAFGSVGGEPVFIQRAKGPHLFGADGSAYIDYVGSWGPMILGHAHPDVVSAIQEAATRGCSYGAPTAGETDMAEAIAEAFPSMEMSRLVSSGTEATMGALRVARGFTGRDLIVKCVGAYHGGADYLLVKAGSGLATLGEPDSGGVPAAIAATTRLVEYNDVVGLRALFAAEGAQIAAVIIEPVAGNMGCVPPEQAWLDALSAVTRDHGALLIFDEVMTGFRVARGGAQQRYGIKPDLTCLGKIVGGGLPMGAYGGRRDVMSKIAPLGPVYQAGTLSGNPLAVAAGLTTLGLLRTPRLYERIEASSAALADGLAAEAAAAGVQVRVQRVASMLTVFFTDAAVRDWPSAARCHRGAFAAWHAGLLANGVYWPPSQFEAAFVSLAHDEETLAATLAAARTAFAAARAHIDSE